ncbi:OLC1v1037236C1 [Oldenlandia corymbosa var. corymbosa]|uniref:OLC1v1037236C1 n=1 Tax=Oldenlandia corymbosa var. corymbosa TaxID=529605 RepID=A0AAV1D0V5_OLDCO|nr:OLC1v1037236C1 [Oldenlandia corymbosa var. corymbosa]
MVPRMATLPPPLFSCTTQKQPRALVVSNLKLRPLQQTFSSPARVISQNSCSLFKDRQAAAHYSTAGGAFHGEIYEIQPAIINLGIVIVHPGRAYVVEKLGKYSKTLTAGVHLVNPFLDRIMFVHSLKERLIHLPSKEAITKDGVPITVTGILLMKVVDPVLASYGSENPIGGLIELAQSILDTEIGKLSLDRLIETRPNINQTIEISLNEVSTAWGIKCTRYVISDIGLPDGVKMAMDLEAEIKRKKAAEFLEEEREKEAMMFSSKTTKFTLAEVSKSESCGTLCQRIQ